MPAGSSACGAAWWVAAVHGREKREARVWHEIEQQLTIAILHGAALRDEVVAREGAIVHPVSWEAARRDLPLDDEARAEAELQLEGASDRIKEDTDARAPAGRGRAAAFAFLPPQTLPECR